MDRLDRGLLERLLQAEDYRIRAAAVRAVRYNGHVLPDQKELLEMAATDEHGRVRLEAIVAASWLSRESGLKGYLGTNDLQEVLRRVQGADEDAILIYRAMIRQIGKEIGARATVVGAPINAIVITGGMATSQQFCSALIERVRFIGPTKVIPGSMELEAMADGAWRVLNGEEEPREYV